MSRASGTPRVKPRNNVYTALSFIAFAALATACGILWAVNADLTKEEQDKVNRERNMSNPMFIVDRAKA